jgi:uncharacterized protein (TIGR03790 family)
MFILRPSPVTTGKALFFFRLKMFPRRMRGLLLPAALLALQNVSAAGYNDVVVVVNTNSRVSLAIGAYFRSARGIPSRNIIPVNTDTAETITDSGFASLRSQIEAFLLTNNLADSINYIVTTKGIPLRVDRGDAGEPWSASASVESELACILGPLSSQIGRGGGQLSPYCGQSAHFSHKTFGIYLVTRLDGYSLQDIERLIDKSGPGMPLGPGALFVLDEDPLWGGTYACLNANLAKAYNRLMQSGFPAVLNTDTVFLARASGVAGYAGWGSNDHHASQYSDNGSPHNAWVPGAIAETYVSTSARSFMAPPVYGQSLIADLIQEGASGARGCVYEPFVSGMSDVSILFARYTSGFNLAESYFSASRLLSWMDVVVGDPKTSIIPSAGSALPVVLNSFDVSPCAGGSVRVAWVTLSENGSFGFTVERRTVPAGAFIGIASSFTPGAGTSLTTRAYSWVDPDVAPGAYEYRIRQTDLDGTVHESGGRGVTVSTGGGDTEESRTPGKTGLLQNYPNPFNPATTITYRISAGTRVTITIHDLLGREVARLVDRDQGPGLYTVTWDARAAATGVYICRLRAEGRTWEKRAVFMK